MLIRSLILAVNILSTRYVISFTVEEKFHNVYDRLQNQLTKTQITAAPNKVSIISFEPETPSKRKRNIEIVIGSPTTKTAWGFFRGIAIEDLSNFSRVTIFVDDEVIFEKIRGFFEVQEHWKLPLYEQVKLLHPTYSWKGIIILAFSIALFTYFMGALSTALIIILLFVSIEVSRLSLAIANKEALKTGF